MGDTENSFERNEKNEFKCPYCLKSFKNLNCFKKNINNCFSFYKNQEKENIKNLEKEKLIEKIEKDKKKR